MSLKYEPDPLLRLSLRLRWNRRRTKLFQILGELSAEIRYTLNHVVQSRIEAVLGGSESQRGRAGIEESERERKDRGIRERAKG